MNYQMFIHSFLAGIAILIIAILINGLTTLINLTTWYAFIQSIINQGFKETLFSTNIQSFVFLFLIYPFLLGLTAYISLKLLF